jgi:subtilisin-like proprotein convertase family protein
MCLNEPKSIDDDNACTVDSCSSSTGLVSHIPVADRDGDKCTLDACEEDSGISDAGVLDPDDDNECTVDTCDPAIGALNTPLDPDDGDGCTIDQCVDPGPVTHAFCASNLCDIDTENCLTVSGVSTFSISPGSTISAVGTPVVTSPLSVSAIGTVIRDIDVTTTITHTWNDDLDITLTSPAGTVVTLTTLNGAGLDNGFNGTIWNDSASVPVTDHTFVDTVAATTLIPEEALGAFIGEDPNGQWVLTVSDNISGDGGTLASWSLNITTISAAPTTTVKSYTQSTSTAITDDNVVTTSTLNVPAVAADGTQICSLTVNTTIPHTNPSDLNITLTSATGTVILLSSGNGAGFDDVFNGTLWNDDANPGGQVPYATNNGLVTDHLYVGATVATPLVPEGALSKLVGEDPTGTWTLSVTDTTTNVLTGTITSWGLNVGRCFRAVPPP